MSDKPTLQFYIDGISEYEHDLHLKNKGEEYKPKLQDYFESRGYTIKKELTKRTKQVFNPITHDIDFIDYKFYSFYTYLNRDALIQSIKRNQLSRKGCTWQGDEQIEIAKGRKGKRIHLIDEKGNDLFFESLKDFAKDYQGTSRAAREAMKKRDGNCFQFKGATFWIAQ